MRKPHIPKPRVMRYRKPSIKTITGVTRAKKRINKAVGITAVKAPMRAPANAVRRAKRAVGYEREPMKAFRFLRRIFK